MLRGPARAWSKLPARYQAPWDDEFWGFVCQALHPGVAILDVGSGRQPRIQPAQRPAESHYVGLDVSPSELATAPPGSYDEIVAADAQRMIPALCDRFDLIVSWLALEHIRRLDRAASAIYRYARPGGWFVACLSGRYAAFAIANRILPAPLGARLVAQLRERPLETVFQAHYHQCTERGLRKVFAPWEELQILPLWRGAGYFDRLLCAQRLYLRYENWAMARGLNDLATYYVVAARKGLEGSQA